MKTNGAPTAVASPIPPEIQELLGPPPLLPNEDTKLYYALLGSLAQTIRPTDVIAWPLIRDLADRRIDIARYRRSRRLSSRRLTTKKQRRSCQIGRTRFGTFALSSKGALKKKKRCSQNQVKRRQKSSTSSRISTIASTPSSQRPRSASQKLKRNWRMLLLAKRNLSKNFIFGSTSTNESTDYLRAPEDRFSAALEELDRHIRGNGSVSS
jgi:hypothetical protein